MYAYNQALVLVRSKQKTEHGFSRVIQKFEKKFWRENQQLAQNHSKKAQSNESFLDISQMLGYKTQSASIYLLGKHMKKVWVSNQEQFKRKQLTVSNPAKRVSVDRNSNDGHPRRPMRRRKCGCFATNIMRRMRGRIRNSSWSNNKLVQDLRWKLWSVRCRIGGEEHPVFLAPKLHFCGARGERERERER